MMHSHVEVLADAKALAEYAAKWLVEIARQTRGICRIALSGGSTPKAMYALLAAEPLRSRMPWDRLELFWGDERFVPPDDQDSNYHMAYEALLAHVPIDAGRIHRMPTDGTPDDAARRYEALLKQIYGADRPDPGRPFFDAQLLGMGGDGHTASLLPGEPQLDERVRWVVPVTKGRPEARLSLTFPLIDSSRHVVFLLSGSEKAAPFARIRAGDTELPAAKVNPVGELHWFVDRAAFGS
ncbi:MAG TPA: 6-phosphogluconolactonase [Stellaceae bacterium]|jgi:6-phosphogluconolactonase|nr:6-phosphogluconolactonase [Stellaceae bacterium]